MAARSAGASEVGTEPVPLGRACCGDLDLAGKRLPDVELPGLDRNRRRAVAEDVDRLVRRFASAGVEPDTPRRRLTRILCRDRVPDSRAGRHVPRRPPEARQAFASAEDSASPGTVELLRAIVRTPSASGREAFPRIGITDPRAARWPGC